MIIVLALRVQVYNLAGSMRCQEKDYARQLHPQHLRFVVLMQGHKEMPAKVGLLLSTGLALSISLGAILPPAVQAEDSVQKRREDMERRKELLAKT